MVVVISDYYEKPETVIKTVEPLRFRGNDVILFHILDPKEVHPKLGEPVILVDLETDDSMEVSPDYVHTEYRQKIDSHIEALREKARGAGMDYFLLVTENPLDAGLRQYLTIRQGRM
jgi:hypothetical protein